MDHSIPVIGILHPNLEPKQYEAKFPEEKKHNLCNRAVAGQTAIGM